MIVDCDIHYSVGATDKLYPYWPRYYVEYIEDFGPMMPGLGYTNMPGNGSRHDLWEDTKINLAATHVRTYTVEVENDHILIDLHTRN